jgi:long-chain acyl-CoA synthetase
MDKIWLQSYSPFVPMTIDPDQYANLPAAFADFCKTYAGHRAFSNFGSAMTYRQLDQYTLQLAAYFQQELELRSGDRLALMMPNILQYPVALFAALRAGLSVVNVNPLYTARELKQELNDSGAKAIVVLDNFAHVVAEILPEVPLKHILITKIGDLFGFFKGMVFNAGTRIFLRKIPYRKIPAAHYFKAALKAGAKLKFSPPTIRSEAIAFIQYTGGTTGTPKGAMLSHRNLLANILQCRAWIKGELELGKEILLAALPLYHIFSLMVSCFTFLALGGECVLITNPRDIRGLVRSWRQSRPTCFIGLNTLFLHLMNDSQFSRLDFRFLKLSVSGGMPTQLAVAQQWQNLTGCVVTEGYGLTEASPVVTINPLGMTWFNQSVGLPVPATDVKICDDAGRELAIDEVGELWVKGPQVMLGYWQNDAETAIVLDNEGWLKTGDMVRMDAQGFIYLVDRKKDLIIVSGFNVYPSEVEAVIAAHPGVAEVVVIGEPDSATSEAVKAVIVKKDPRLTEKNIHDYCRELLTPYKVPKIIEFRDSLPKSSVGKVLRRELRS